MNNRILIFCDTEIEYAQQMTAFLKKRKEVPWKLRTYTSVASFLQDVDPEGIEVLLVAENAYTDEVRKLSVLHTVLLNESGVLRWREVCNVDKYQRAEDVFKAILNIYLEMEGTALPKLEAGKDLRLIGMYSPVRRCLQTSFALTLGQMLAEEYKTLYLNFEHYAGITELVPDIQTRDLADLMYFLNGEKEKFRLWMKTMLHRCGELDYIPPMRAGQNLISVVGTEWKNLLQRIAELGEYEYVILDLSENIQGLFDILRMCGTVFTLTKADKLAQRKMTQYEQVLALYEYEDVLDKTHTYSLPLFRSLPEQMEQFTKGELASYVKGVIEDVVIWKRRSDLEKA
ncbi:MAG: hypothetical protein LBQ15_10290 [Clostridium sp.]|nr:hypothetical protein [Clostridium sp.]